jgi:hypothetical protein
MEGASQHCEDLHPHMKAAVYSKYGEHSRAASRKSPHSSYGGRVTSKPHLTACCSDRSRHAAADRWILAIETTSN